MHSSASVRQTPSVSCLASFCWCFACMMWVPCKEFNKPEKGAVPCFRICKVNLKILQSSTTWPAALPRMHCEGWWVQSRYSYFVFSIALNDKKKGKGHKGSALIAQRRRHRFQCRRGGTFVMAHDQAEQLKDTSDAFSVLVPFSCNRFADGFKVSLGRGCQDVLPARRGESDSSECDHYRANIEPSPPHHLPQKEAFKWHLFHSLALSRFKSVGSPERIDILLADWSLKATGVKGEQGARRPGVGTTPWDVYSVLCSLRECYQPLRQSGCSLLNL